MRTKLYAGFSTELDCGDGGCEGGMERGGLGEWRRGQSLYSGAP